MDKIQCIRLKDGYFVLNTDTLMHQIVSFGDMKELTTQPNGVEQLITQLEGKPYESRLTPSLASQVPLRPHLLPSYDCNYKCAYCYENRRKHITDHMRPDYIPHIQSFYDAYNVAFGSSFSIEEVIVSGGEPFVPSNRAVVRTILSYWSHLPVSFITNGVYINECRDLLLSHPSISLSVSIDGTKHTHYKKRIPSKGTDYDSMLEGVSWALTNGMRVFIVCIFHPEYLMDYPSFFDEMENLGWLHNPQLNISFNLEISDTGSDGISSQYLEETLKAFSRLKKMDARTYKVKAHGLMPGFTRLANALEQEKTSKSYGLYRCGVLAQPSYAFMPDGSVNFCSATEDEKGCVGRYWPDVEVNVDRIIEIQKRRIDQLANCKECPKRVFCGGGCLATALAKNHDIKETYCGIWENPTFLKYLEEFH